MNKAFFQEKAFSEKGAATRKRWQLPLTVLRNNNNIHKTGTNQETFTKEKQVNVPVLEVKNVSKVYHAGKPSETRVLKGISFSIAKGEFVAIMGPSGSGKTTLLDILGCLLRPSGGELLIDGQAVDFTDDNRLAALRQRKIGFVFQHFNLLPSSSALDNVALPLQIAGAGRTEARKRAASLLETVGLSHRLHNRPSELSGGEQQRVALARALANDPPLILADEPTGNLDTKTGGTIMDVLGQLNSERGYTIVMITHDPTIARRAHRLITLKDGEITGGL